jgi:hypothetical protein
MSNKYHLKLEKTITTANYGTFLIDLLYDPTGLKIVSIYNEKLEPSLRHNLDIVLNLVNFCLIKKISPQEIAEHILRKPQNYNNQPLDEVLEIVAQAILDAPSTVEQIRPDILQELFTTVQQVTQQAIPANSSQNSQPLSPNTPEPELDIPPLPVYQQESDQIQPESEIMNSQQDYDSFTNEEEQLEAKPKPPHNFFNPFRSRE